MDIIVCIHPLYLTYVSVTKSQIVTQNDTDFLIVWWSAFGILSLLEKYSSITSFPFYSIIKVVLLTSLYSEQYRNIVVSNVLKQSTALLSYLKKLLVDVLSKHYPNLASKLDFNTNTASSTTSNLYQKIYSYFDIFGMKSQ